MTTVRNTKELFVQGLLLLLLIGLAAYANSRRHIEVVFSAVSEQAGQLQIFHDARGDYSEARSKWFKLAADQPAQHHLQTSGGQSLTLRLDPPLGTVTTVCGLGVGRSGIGVQFEIQHVDEASVVQQADCLRVVPAEEALDPKLVVQFRGVAADRIARAAAWHKVFLATLPALVLLVFWLLHRRRGQLAAWMVTVLPGVAWLDRRLHWSAALLMLVFGIGYVFITPPGAVADEEAHLAKVVRIAHGAPFGDSGTKLLPSTRQMYGPFSDYPTRKQPFTGEQLQTQLQRPVECEATTSALARGANGYFPHQYLLPTLAYKAACATGAPFGAFLYIARLLNLLLATALVTWGLFHARHGRWGLWLIALLPMSLFQMTSLSADSLALSLGIAWLGLVSGIAAGGLQPARAAPALWVLSLAIALLKPGSAWILVSLVFCKPAYEAASASFVAALARFVALPWVVHLLWTLFASGEAPVLAGVDPSTQVRSLLTNPMQFLGVVTHTYLGEYAIVLLQRMVGVLGWLDVGLAPRAYLAGSVALLAALWTRDSEHDPVATPRYVVPVALLLAMGSMVMIALPLFVYWTHAGSWIVTGLQGRYFLATAAFVLVWCSMRSPPLVRALLVAFVILTVLAINVEALCRLYDAYYVSGRH